MWRAIIPLLLVVSSGCFSLRTRLPDDHCEDVMPPPIAGKYWYHHRLDDFLTSCTAQRAAHQDLKHFKRECGPLSCDYKEGYRQAYIDLAAGRPACVPAVPPPKYWHAWHRSAAGRDGVDQWYIGYRDGLDNGMNSSVSRFNRVVPGPDACCVSAAYINPYAPAAAPNAIQSPGGQTISQQQAPQDSGVVPAAATNEPPPVDPHQSPPTAPPVQNFNALFEGR